MSFAKRLISGFVGAVTITLLNEVYRRLQPQNAPRLDLLGERAVAKLTRDVLHKPLDPAAERAIAFAGDLAINTVYFSMVGKDEGEAPITRGIALGNAMAGLASRAAQLLKLGDDTTSRTPETQTLTSLWYTLGGIAAALTFASLTRRSKN